MSRKKLTEKTLSENQEGLFALANALKVDADVTIYAKLVLGYIIKLYGRDISKEDGYAHVSNAEMRKGCEIGSDTMTNAVVELVNAGLITVERGKKRSKGEKGVENRYFLPDEIKEKIHFKTNSIDISTEKENISTEKIHQIDELLKRIEALELRINELTEENRVLSEKVETIAEKRKSAMDMEMEMDIYNNYSTGTSCTGTNINKKESILTDTKEKPEETCGKGTGDDYIQPPAKPYFFDPRYFGKRMEQATDATVVSSSLQFIEEENHPDTNTSSNDGLKQADRLNISQSITKTQPQPLDKGNAAEWLKNIRSELKHEVYEWSLTLTCTPEYLTGDDYNPIVTKVMNNHPEWINYQGQFSLCELGQYTLQLMENRMNNSDITGIIAKNNRKRYPDFNDNTDIVSESTVRLREAV